MKTYKTIESAAGADENALRQLQEKADWLEKKMLRYEQALYRIIDTSPANNDARMIAKGALS